MCRPRQRSKRSAFARILSPLSFPTEPLADTPSDPSSPSLHLEWSTHRCVKLVAVFSLLFCLSPVRIRMWQRILTKLNRYLRHARLI